MNAKHVRQIMWESTVIRKTQYIVNIKHPLVARIDVQDKLQ